MRIKRKQLTFLIGTLLLLLLTFTACSLGGGSKSGDSSKTSGGLHIAVPTEENVIKSDLAVIDISNVDQGYLCVKYTGSNQKVKLQLSKENDTYTYNLLKRDAYEIFPISDGDGSYSIRILENISGEQYSQVFGQTVDVKLADANLPFLYSSEYVNYTAEDKIVSLSKKVAAKETDQLKQVENVYNYVTDTISYDYDLATSVETEYLPNIDTILKKEKGICFDYAAVMTAMLRIQDIPTKLVIGYAGEVYHAWINVYVKDVGWVDGLIKFDGQSWTMMDPTAAAASDGEDADYIKDGSKYNALYYY